MPRHSPVAVPVEEEGRSRTGRLPVPPLPRRQRTRIPVEVSYGTTPELLYLDHGFGVIRLVGFGEDAHSHAAAGTATFTLSGSGTEWFWSPAVRRELLDVVELELADLPSPTRGFTFDFASGHVVSVTRRPIEFVVELPDGTTTALIEETE
jgi:hypothetical protein